MSVTVGGVEIAIGTDNSGLAAGIAKAKTTVKSGMDSIQGAAQAVQGYLSMLGVGAFAGYIKSAIDAAGALADLSQKTGVSAKDLSGLEYAAKMSGTTLEGVAKGLQKLATNMYDAAGGSKEAGAAFKTLGIEVTTTDGKLRSTDDVMGDVADQFANMQDGADKSALAVKLFGKSGVELIPMLNEGSAGLNEMKQRAEELGLVISDQTASAMESLGDKFDTVQLAGTGVARQMAVELTPTLTSVADTFLEATRQGGFMQGMVEVLGGAIKVLVSIGYGAAAVFEQIGLAIGGLLGAAAAGLAGNFSEAKEILRLNEEDSVKSSERWASKISDLWSAETVAVVKVKNEQKALTAERKEGESAADKQAKKIEDVKKKLDDEYAALGMTAAQAAIYKAQTDAGVTANSAAGIEIAAKVTKLTNEKETLALTKAANESYNKAMQDQEADLNKTTGALLAKVNQAQKELDQVGLSKTEIEKLELARLKDVAAMKQQQIEQGINVEWNKKELKAIQEQIDLQEELVGIVEKGEVAAAQKKNAEDALKKWEDTAKDIEKALTDALMNGFNSGKDMVTSIRDYIVNAFKTMVVKLAVQPVMGAITGAMGMVTGNSAMAASGAAQQASGMSNIMSTISTISTMASAFGSSLAAGFSSTIASFGATTAASISGGMASIATGTSTAIASGLGQIIGTLGPYALAAVAVYGLLGGFKGTYVTGQGKNATYDADGKRTGTSVRQWDRVTDGGKPFEDYLDGIANTYQAMAKGLGIKTKALALGFETNDYDGGRYGFNATVGGKTALQVDETKITDGAIALTASRAVFAALQASEMPTYLAGIFDGMTASAMTQDQLNAALQTAQAYQALHLSLQSLPLANLRDLSYSAAAGLVAAAGGMDKLISGLQAYYDLYYSKDEKSVVSANSIASSLAAVGIDGSKLTTRDDFRTLFEGINASTSVGQQQMAALLQVAPTFATLSDYLVEQEKSLGDLATITPQLTILAEATDAAANATVTAADATADAIQTTTDTVAAGTVAVVAAVNSLTTTVTNAVTAATNASTTAINTLTARLDALDSSNRLANEGAVAR